MAGTGGASPRDLIAEIRSQGYRFRFPQAVRLLARAAGSAGVPRSVRFRTPVSLSFPASEIAEVRPREAHGEAAADETLDLTVNFMGLTGPSGALPTAYTELLIERRHHHRDSGAHAFLDLFSHRAIALFYEAWRKYRFYLDYEAGERGGFSRNLLDLVGVGVETLQARLEEGRLSARFFTYFAGLLAQRPVSAENLAALIQGYFGVGVTVEQFVGQWQTVSPGEQTRLGRQCAALGRDTLCGERVWDRQNKIRICLGPLDRAHFDDFTPGSPGALALRELVHFCVGHGLACDVVLVLARDAIPAPLLREDAKVPLRLGYNCWPRTRALDHDSADMQFALLA